MRFLLAAVLVTASLGACKSPEEEALESLGKMLKGEGDVRDTLKKATRAVAKSLLGTNAPPGLADQAADTAAAMLKGLGAKLEGLGAKPGSAPGLSMVQKPALTPAEEKALVQKLDLGAKDEVFPRELAGVKLGMSVDALKAARPNASFGRPSEHKRRGTVVQTLVGREDGAQDSPFSSFSYHFENGSLRASFATLRVSALTDELVAKAKAKWGVPRNDAFTKHMESFYAKRGGGMKEWVLPSARVKLEKTGIRPEVRLYFAAK
jgi:hypothetical protein